MSATSIDKSDSVHNDEKLKSSPFREMIKATSAAATSTPGFPFTPRSSPTKDMSIANAKAHSAITTIGFEGKENLPIGLDGKSSGLNLRYAIRSVTSVRTATTSMHGSSRSGGRGERIHIRTYRSTAPATYVATILTGGRQPNNSPHSA